MNYNSVSTNKFESQANTKMNKGKRAAFTWSDKSVQREKKKKKEEFMYGQYSRE